MIDTSGASILKNLLLVGNNRLFSMGQAFPKFSVNGNKIFYDTRYAKDNIGISGSIVDSTMYTNGSKNGDSPFSWVSNPTGAPITDKVDIVDGYVHMRRDGIIINNTNPSHLILTMGASTFGTSGNRFIDLELFKSRINYNYSTGVFTNSGSSTTGGHSAWVFNADGSINTFGDLDIAFSFNSTTVEEIAIYIWVSKNTLETINPTGFDFVGASDFFGASNNPLYGYAKIIANPSSTIQAWGAVNTDIIKSTPWGTISKDLGSFSNNYYSTQYDIGQYAEIGLDLTAMGMDPALNNSDNPCNPPFTRMMIKSRSSVEFNSALQDFTGPHIFLDAPTISAAIQPPLLLTCTRTEVNLSPANYSPTAYYNWSTSNGNIISQVDTPFIKVNQPGKYYLYASVFQGCAQNRDSVIVYQDLHKPTASIDEIGILSLPFDTDMLLLGGNLMLSNYTSPYNSFSGLLWAWDGPNAFSSTVQSPLIHDTGTYRLIVTNISNGCKDTTTNSIENTVVLPVKLLNFNGKLGDNDKVKLSWTVAENEFNDHFEIEKSTTGTRFIKQNSVLSTLKNGIENYTCEEPSTHEKEMYRLKIFDKNGPVSYSNIIVINRKTNESKIEIFPNLVNSIATIHYESDNNENILIRITNPMGQIMRVKQVQGFEGLNKIPIDVSTLGQGIYFVELLQKAKKIVSRITVIN
jgi:hypothetical protein